MKDEFYADNRDLIKWGGIVHLCGIKGISHVTYVAYYRDSIWPLLDFEGKVSQIPDTVIRHFRNINDIKRLGREAGLAITVIEETFNRNSREQYTEKAGLEVKKQDERQVVFLDPDTGLAIQNANEVHVKPDEINTIWQLMKKGDYLVLYQHSFRDSGWKIKRQQELAEAIRVNRDKVNIWQASEKIMDVAFYYLEKS